MTEKVDDLNHYDVLHVSRDAPVEIIRGSYRTLMQQMKAHPDLGGDTGTAARINSAYAVLSDPVRRCEYDARLDVLSRIAAGFEGARATPQSAQSKSEFIDPAVQCAFCTTAHGLGRRIESDASCANCGGPLCVAANERDESIDQRAMTRIRRRLDVTFLTHWRQSRGFAGHTDDLSLDGLRLVTRQGLYLGQRIRILCPVVDAVGRITYCGQRSAGLWTENVAGVSFITSKIVRSVGGLLSRQA